MYAPDDNFFRYGLLVNISESRLEDADHAERGGVTDQKVKIRGNSKEDFR